MCKFSDFNEFPEEFHRRIKQFLIDGGAGTAQPMEAVELLKQLKIIELKLRDRYFGAGTKTKERIMLTVTQVLAAQKTVVEVLQKNNEDIALSLEDMQELATEIVIALDEVIS